MRNLISTVFFIVATICLIAGTSANAQNQCQKDALNQYNRALDACGVVDPAPPVSNNYCTCVLVKQAERFYQQCAYLHQEHSTSEITCFGTGGSRASDDQAACANFIASYGACD